MGIIITHPIIIIQTDSFLSTILLLTCQLIVCLTATLDYPTIMLHHYPITEMFSMEIR